MFKMISRCNLCSNIRLLIRICPPKEINLKPRVSSQNVFANAFHQDSTKNSGASVDGPIITDPIHSTTTEDRTIKISKAMKAYLDRAQTHDKFMKEQTKEFETGRRHLANMMGVDPETFTQRDIDEAISYLMPSGLFDKKARPMMKHPNEIFPRRKAAEFNESGRPFNPFFYTGMPNYYQQMFAIVDNLKKLDDFEDKMIQKGIQEPLPETRLNLSGTEWISYGAFQKIILEEVREYRYDYFIRSMGRLAEHPYSFRCKDFILKFRKSLVASIQNLEIPPLTIDENGKSYAKGRGGRKLTVAHVIVYANGTGKMEINGKDLNYFPLIQDREQLLFPLQFTGFLNQVDVVAEVDTKYGGTSCQSGAIRHGISVALRSFVDTEMVEKMRIAGLLTRDPRTRERKKPGQEGARRKFTWKKR